VWGFHSSPAQANSPKNMATAFAHVKDGVSVLMDVFKQFANKNIVECVKDGFPDAYFVV
jgi:hypothetical protein